MNSFHLNVREAQDAKQGIYDDAYGPGVYEVSAGISNCPIMRVFVPEDQVQSAIDWAMTIRDLIGAGIVQAQNDWQRDLDTKEIP